MEAVDLHIHRVPSISQSVFAHELDLCGNESVSTSGFGKSTLNESEVQENISCRDSFFTPCCLNCN